MPYKNALNVAVLFLVLGCNNQTMSDAELKKESARVDSLAGNSLFQDTVSHGAIGISKAKYYSHQVYGYKDNQPIFAATCFILRYKSKYYIVTNYHVMTGKDPVTGVRLKPEPDSLLVSYYDSLTKEDSGYFYPLYDQDHKRTFFAVGKIDIAVLEIYISGLSTKAVYPIEEINIDTSYNIAPATPLRIIGFPKNGKMINGWEPTIIKANSTEPPPTPKGMFNPSFYFDTEIADGTSGSPTYIFDPQNGNLKLIGIVSEKEGFKENKNIKSSSVFIATVLRMIDVSKKF